MNNLISFDDFIVESKDPKVGTGKKPKNSGRRLYTDENPKDTVPVKFRTKEDVQSTINSQSFKSKSHKRQSQILNLIEQRLRVALERAKDPDTKSRLKRAHDYIKSKCEASKKKTQRMNESHEEFFHEIPHDDFYIPLDDLENFTKNEMDLLSKFSLENDLKIENLMRIDGKVTGETNHIRIIKENHTGIHRILFDIYIAKSKDEWFFVSVETVNQKIEDEDPFCYKADQFEGLLYLLDYIMINILD